MDPSNVPSLLPSTDPSNVPLSLPTMDPSDAPSSLPSMVGSCKTEVGQSSILNHTVVFGAHQPIEDRVANETGLGAIAVVATRKRHLSEGDIAIDNATLTTPS
jgi:hypothetical protein